MNIVQVYCWVLLLVTSYLDGIQQDKTARTEFCGQNYISHIVSLKLTSTTRNK